MEVHSILDLARIVRAHELRFFKGDQRKQEGKAKKAIKLAQFNQLARHQELHGDGSFGRAVKHVFTRHGGAFFSLGNWEKCVSVARRINGKKHATRQYWGRSVDLELCPKPTSTGSMVPRPLISKSNGRSFGSPQINGLPPERNSVTRPSSLDSFAGIFRCIPPVQQPHRPTLLSAQGGRRRPPDPQQLKRVALCSHHTLHMYPGCRGTRMCSREPA